MIDTWEVPPPTTSRPKRPAVVVLWAVLAIAAVASVWAYGYRFWGAPAVPNIVYFDHWQYEHGDGMDGEPPPPCSSPEELRAEGLWPGVPVGDMGRDHKDPLSVSWEATVTARQGAGAVLGVDPDPVGPGFPFGGLLVPGGPGCYVYFGALT